MEYIIIIIIKTSSTGPSGKDKIVYKLLTQPHKQLHHAKLKNKLREATNEIDWPLKTIWLFGVKLNVGKVIPHTSLGQQETPYK